MSSTKPALPRSNSSDLPLATPVQRREDAVEPEPKPWAPPQSMGPPVVIIGAYAVGEDDDALLNGHPDIRY
ncbi:hypothetical protein LJY25_05800 [Hymenobacter sp. BT175]|uniref:hypothetical protein n=1 Tax=Hymenobacter translucens TaxID=2886507 RepID=UPI001D0DC64A|nr:hypothetical protein [Hymenobacter translucens]MCC2545950.1 hypothetical protein [Hymenobacter translucens]